MDEVHASLELIEAMLGRAPWMASTMAWMTNVCGARHQDGRTVLALGKGYVEHRLEVTCPRCLVAMDAAREGQRIGARL